MRKFTSIEGTPYVVSPEDHKVIEEKLRRLGKTSARELSDSQRQELRLPVDQSDDEC